MNKVTTVKQILPKLQDRQREHSARLSSLYATVGRAMAAAELGWWDDVQLLLAQAEDLEESTLGSSDVTSAAWEALGFPDDG